MEKRKPQWSSHVSFIIATVGSAVGLGNIWRFPYITGKYGGAAFLITYLLLIAFICVIPLICELLIGKTYRTDIVSALTKISSKFKPFGWVCILTVLMIPCFYFVVGGWILDYIWLFMTNNLPCDFAKYFSNYSSQTFMPCFFTILFLVLTAFFPFRGVNKGIEKANNIMMPLFMIMLLGMMFFALSLPGAKEGLEFMFKPDFSFVDKSMVLVALGQALFTLSIGMGTIVTYGSYMKDNTDIVKSAYTLIFFDTLIAIIAGMVIFPIVFSFNVEPTAGATLVFISLPELFLKLPFSSFLGVLFFFLLFFAAITSGISILETSIYAVSNNFKISRKTSTVIVSLIVALFSIVATIKGQFFNFLDYTTSNILLPLNTLIICLITGWCLKGYIEKEFKNPLFKRVFSILLKFIVPLLLLLVLISGI